MKLQAHTGPVPEFFVSGLDHIELLGSNSRHVWFSERRIGSATLFVPAVHIVTPNISMPEAILKITKALAIAVIGFEEHPLH